jgi:hypothetical protein
VEKGCDGGGPEGEGEEGELEAGGCGLDSSSARIASDSPPSRAAADAPTESFAPGELTIRREISASFAIEPRPADR